MQTQLLDRIYRDVHRGWVALGTGQEALILQNFVCKAKSEE